MQNNELNTLKNIVFQRFFRMNFNFLLVTHFVIISLHDSGKQALILMQAQVNLKRLSGIAGFDARGEGRAPPSFYLYFLNLASFLVSMTSFENCLIFFTILYRPKTSKST